MTAPLTSYKGEKIAGKDDRKVIGDGTAVNNSDYSCYRKNGLSSRHVSCKKGKGYPIPLLSLNLSIALIIMVWSTFAIRDAESLDVNMGVSDYGLLGKEAWFFCNYSDNGESIIGLEWFFSPDPSDLGTAIMSYDPYNHDVQVSRNWEKRIRFPDKSSNTSFTISPLERSDQGVYRCTVVGDDTVTKEKYLEVYDPPDEKDGLKVVEDFKPIAIGETMVYTCQSSNSSPPATLTWYINDTPIAKENILLDKPITDPNTGLSTSVVKIKIVGSTDLEGAKLICRATFPRQPMKEWVRVIKVTNVLANQSSRMKIDDINQMMMSTESSATAPVRNDMAKAGEAKKNSGSTNSATCVFTTSMLVMFAAKLY